METVKLYISANDLQVILAGLGEVKLGLAKPTHDKIEAQVKAQTAESGPRAVADPDKAEAIMTGTDAS